MIAFFSRGCDNKPCPTDRAPTPSESEALSSMHPTIHKRTFSHPSRRSGNRLFMLLFLSSDITQIGEGGGLAVGYFFQTRRFKYAPDFASPARTSAVRRPRENVFFSPNRDSRSPELRSPLPVRAASPYPLMSPMERRSQRSVPCPPPPSLPHTL